MGFLDTITSGVSEYAQKIKDTVSNTMDPSQARLGIAGLLKGGIVKRQIPQTARVGFAIDTKNGSVPVEEDWRIRVSVGDSSGIFYKGSDPGILTPLVSTNGVIFPYTPSITTSYTANYSSQKTTHSNYPAYFYESSEVASISIGGDFTVQTIEEGQYLLACIYFFRASTKMFYGEGGGNPPPILFLNGYGNEYFKNVPCVLTGFQHVMSPDVDYLEIPSVTASAPYYPISAQNVPGPTTSQGAPQTTRVPLTSQIQITLQPVYSRKTVSEFDLTDFATGKLIDKGFL